MSEEPPNKKIFACIFFITYYVTSFLYILYISMWVCVQLIRYLAKNGYDGRHSTLLCDSKTENGA